MYLYKTTILKDTSEYMMSQIEKDQHASDRVDFETNYKSLIIEISDIIILETTLLMSKTYTQFKQLINGSITWNNVQVISVENRYIFYIISEISL